MGDGEGVGGVVGLGDLIEFENGFTEPLLMDNGYL
jgi:hypothetical protein